MLRERVGEKDNGRDTLNMEEALEFTMKPVLPRQEYVKDMRQRLVHYAEPRPVVLEDHSLPLTLWILAGLASILVLCLVGLRGVLARR